jgi:hypothetical protein
MATRLAATDILLALEILAAPIPTLIPEADMELELDIASAPIATRLADTLTELEELIAKLAVFTVLAVIATVDVSETENAPIQMRLAASVMVLVSLIEAAPRLTP